VAIAPFHALDGRKRNTCALGERLLVDAGQGLAARICAAVIIGWTRLIVQFSRYFPKVAG